MNNFYRPLGSLLAFALITTLHAETERLGQISVTATKTARALSEIPATVNVISEADINQSVATSADELLREVAGVDVKHPLGAMATGTSNKVIMRGFGGGTEGRMLLLVDGVPMNDSYFSGIEWNQVATDDIKQIEVLKGAGSALYGSNALGGVINIITKTPKVQKSHLDLSYGSMNTKIGFASTEGSLGSLGYYFSGRLLDSDGYQADIGSNIKTNTIKRGSERQNATAKLNYDIDDSSSFGLNYLFFHNQSTGVLDVDGGYNPYEQQMHTVSAKYAKYFENNSDLSITLYDKISDTSYDSLNSAKDARSYENSATINEMGGSLQYTAVLNDMHTLTSGIDFQLGDAKSEDNYVSGAYNTVGGNQDYQAIVYYQVVLDKELWAKKVV